jgi:hypothetical protein
MKIKNVAIILLLIFISGSVGWYIGLRQGINTAGITREMLSYFEGVDYLKLQFQQGSCETVKQAILDFEKKADLRKNTKDPWYDERGYYVDKTLSHGRIFLLDNKLNNRESAKIHLNQAINACEKAGWQECTEEKIVWAINEISKKAGQIACLDR